ncbi:MAG: oxygenase MpaB family protein, partial [Myxococcota bacterium]
ADAIVAGELARDGGVALREWIGDRGASPDGVAALPVPAFDEARARAGQAFFGRVGVQAILALFCAGLPGCYAGAHGATQLLLAGRSYEAPRRRFMETARFVIAVMEPGALVPGGRAVEEARRVRLVHALARRAIRRHPHYHPELGPPINQEDLLGTLLAFGLAVVDALPALGMEVPDADAEDYLYAWRVAGELLGVDVALEGLADARAARDGIWARQHAASPAGVALTRALLSLLDELLPPPLAGDLPPALMRHLLPERVADLLEVPRARRRMAPALRGLRELGRVTGALARSPARDAVEIAGRSVFLAVHRWGLAGEPPTYHPPAA